MTPDRLEILDKGRVLRIVWADGRRRALRRGVAPRLPVGPGPPR
jgi:hypothetical protein